MHTCHSSRHPAAPAAAHLSMLLAWCSGRAEGPLAEPETAVAAEVGVVPGWAGAGSAAWVSVLPAELGACRALGR